MRFFLFAILVSLLSACIQNSLEQQASPTSNNQPLPSIGSQVSPSKSEPLRTINRSDLSNVDRLLMQRERAGKSEKKLASKLLEAGEKALMQAKKDGPKSNFVSNGGWSGALKSYCSSAVSFPTTKALLGCAESIAMADASFDTKLKRFKESSDIYKTIVEFSEKTNTPLSAAERQVIQENTKCLDAFLKNPNPKSPGCSLISDSLKVQ
ncbi:MAG: hypothetical protein KME21_00965 [Desmonostoc vinosum HA7617-LM4]|jgi:hypothetical protein|nr:hypothetical protein [Desmonostoc vinosum HA7617-LM4]